MIKRQTLMATTCFASLCGALYGQTGEKTASFQYFVTNDTGPGNITVRMEGVGAKTVAGKPFSANEERETVQILGDGTRIDKKETDKYYRDNLGRTRIERDNGATVAITDPIAGFTSEVTKTSHRLTSLRPSGMGAGAGGGAGVGAGTGAALPPRMVKRMGISPEGAQAGVMTQQGGVMTQELQVSMDKLKAEIAATGRVTTSNSSESQTKVVFAQTGAAVASGEQSVSEDLGTQMINGVPAQGTRVTITIAVGQIGNDREIKVVSERWFSTELQMLVKSSNKDPRFGETTYQLTNVLTGAQDPTLFEIPADLKGAAAK